MSFFVFLKNGSDTFSLENPLKMTWIARVQRFSLSNRSSSVLVLRVKVWKHPSVDHTTIWAVSKPLDMFISMKFILNEDHWIIIQLYSRMEHLKFCSKKKEHKTNHCSHLTSLDHLSRSPWLFPAFFSKWILNLPASSSFAVANDAGDASPYWSYLPYL